MGKKDLLKSTSKTTAKKTGKKKAAPKKTAPKKAAPKKTALKKAAPKKTTPKKAAPKKTALKKAAPKKVAQKKKLTGKALLLEKLDSWKPEKLYSVGPDKDYQKNFKSPPFYDDKSKEDIAKINKLLALKFDMKAIIASGEKAAAAKKAAEEKAAAEKAAAEKKAAEEKAAAEKPSPAPKMPEPAYVFKDIEESDQSKKILFMIAACLIIIFTPIIIASYVNKGNYYLEVTDGALELWQGDFAPMGTELLITMPGAVPPEAIKDVYCKKEVFPIVCAYLIDKADTLLEVDGLPDFQYIKSMLNTAKTYAVTKPLLQSINKRMTATDFMVFLYKADVASGTGTAKGRETAIGLLKKAAKLDLGPHEREMVSKKIKALQEIKAAPKK